jgi:hypothetical protein
MEHTTNKTKTLSTFDLMDSMDMLPMRDQRDVLFRALEIKQNVEPEWHVVRCIAAAMGYEKGDGDEWLKKS